MAGETRYKAAVLIGLTAAPVVTIPARQARAFRVIDNRTSELTSSDTDLLPDALAGLDDLDIFSFDDVFPPAGTAGKTDPDDIPETPKKPITRTGDLWVLGKHRIVCGDSTKQETVERLLDGAEPDLMVTDPPYGVNYDATWRYKVGFNTKDGAFGKSANDDTSNWQDAYALFPGSIAYVWMSGLGLPVAASGLDACGFIRRSLIIWDKGHIVIGRGHYHWRHESCWYAVKKGAQAHWTGDRKASTLWEIDNPRKSETGHSSQKPVECMQRALSLWVAVCSGTGIHHTKVWGRRLISIAPEAERRHSRCRLPPTAILPRCRPKPSSCRASALPVHAPLGLPWFSHERAHKPRRLPGRSDSTRDKVTDRVRPASRCALWRCIGYLVRFRGTFRR